MPARDRALCASLASSDQVGDRDCALVGPMSICMNLAKLVSASRRTHSRSALWGSEEQHSSASSAWSRIENGRGRNTDTG